MDQATVGVESATEALAATTESQDVFSAEEIAELRELSDEVSGPKMSFLPTYHY